MMKLGAQLQCIFEVLGLYGVYIGVVENRMETTIILGLAKLSLIIQYPQASSSHSSVLQVLGPGVMLVASASSSEAP